MKPKLMEPGEYETALRREVDANRKVTAIERRLHKASELNEAWAELMLAKQEVERVGNRLHGPRKKNGAKPA